MSVFFVIEGSGGALTYREAMTWPTVPHVGERVAPLHDDQNGTYAQYDVTEVLYLERVGQRACPEQYFGVNVRVSLRPVTTAPVPAKTPDA